MATATVTYTWYYVPKTTTNAATATTGGTAIGSAQTKTIDVTDQNTTGAVSHTVPALADAAIGGGIYVTANVSSISGSGYSNDATAVTKSVGSAVTARALNAGSASVTPTTSARGTKYTATVTLPSWGSGSATNTVMGGTAKGNTVTKTTTASYQWYYCTAPSNQTQPVVGTTQPTGYSAISGQTNSEFSTPSYGQGGNGFGVKVTFAASSGAFTYTSTSYYVTLPKAIPNNTAKLTNITFSGTPQVGGDVTATFTITMS